MESGITKHSREVVRLELAGRILADLLRLSAVLGPGAGHRALGLATPAIPGRVELTFDAPAWRLSLDDIDIDQLSIGQVVMAMYDYAYEQRYLAGQPFYQFKAELEIVEDFVVHLDSELFWLFIRDRVHMWHAGDANWEALPNLYAATSARLDLDMGESLSLKDLAILADMSERSVRNALSASGDAQLRTTRIGGSEWVDNDEARRWLAMRRGFVPTRLEHISGEIGEHPDALTSLYDLGNFIHHRWTALGKTPAMVHRELEWSETRFDYLNGLTGTPQHIDPRDCADLARSLQVSEAWFTTQVMRNLYPQQVTMLLRHETQQELTPRLNVAKDDNARLCTRVRFTLHDGSELFPVRMKNRDTGRVAFRLSKGGTGGNTKEQTLEEEDENQMIEMVCYQGMAVRLQSANGSRQGLYRKDGRSVRSVALDENII